MWIGLNPIRGFILTKLDRGGEGGNRRSSISIQLQDDTGTVCKQCLSVSGKALTSCSMLCCYETAWWINRYEKGNKIPFSISSASIIQDEIRRGNSMKRGFHSVCSGIWTGWTSFFPWNPRKLLTVSSGSGIKKALPRLPTSGEGTKNDKTRKRRSSGGEKEREKPTFPRDVI